MEFYDMPWYQMPAKYQKQMLSAAHSAQYGAILTMGPLGELDFAMASNVSHFLISNDMTYDNHSLLINNLSFSLHDKFTSSQ